jgi:hypothetical protein
MESVSMTMVPNVLIGDTICTYTFSDEGEFLTPVDNKEIKFEKEYALQIGPCCLMWDGKNLRLHIVSETNSRFHNSAAVPPKAFKVVEWPGKGYYFVLDLLVSGHRIGLKALPKGYKPHDNLPRIQ